MSLARAEARIRDVPDFPKPGIVFKDIAPMLQDGASLRAVNRGLSEAIATLKPDMVAGVESRGFLFAPPVADALGVGMVMIRKPGKLPFKTVRMEYALEYGTDVIEMHVDAVTPGQRVVIVDDVLATGGTAAAAGALVASQGAVVVGYAFAVELAFLGGRERLGDTPVVALFKY